MSSDLTQLGQPGYVSVLFRNGTIIVEVNNPLLSGYAGGDPTKHYFILDFLCYGPYRHPAPVPLNAQTGDDFLRWGFAGARRCNPANYRRWQTAFADSDPRLASLTPR